MQPSGNGKPASATPVAVVPPPAPPLPPREVSAALLARLVPGVSSEAGPSSDGGGSSAAPAGQVTVTGAGAAAAPAPAALDGRRTPLSVRRPGLDSAAAGSPRGASPLPPSPFRTQPTAMAPPPAPPPVPPAPPAQGDSPSKAVRAAAAAVARRVRASHDDEIPEPTSSTLGGLSSVIAAVWPGKAAAAGAEAIPRTNSAPSLSSPRGAAPAVAPKARGAKPASPLAAVPSEWGEQLVAGSDAGHVYVWRLGSQTRTAHFVAHAAPVRALCLLVDGSVVTASDDRSLKVWRLAPGEPTCTARLEGHLSAVLCCAPLHDASARLASGAADATVCVWDVTREAVQRTMEGHEGPVRAVVCLPHSARLASGSDDGTLRIWDANSGRCETMLSAHEGGVAALAASGNRRLVSGGCDGGVLLWSRGLDGNWAADRRLGTAASFGPVLALTALPGDLAAAAAADGDVAVYSLATGELAALLRDAAVASGDAPSPILHGPPRVTALAGLRNGKLAVAARTALAVWRPPSDEGELGPLFELPGHTGSLLCLAAGTESGRATRQSCFTLLC